jgi:hypothetical protein
VLGLIGGEGDSVAGGVIDRAPIGFMRFEVIAGCALGASCTYEDDCWAFCMLTTSTRGISCDVEREIDTTSPSPSLELLDTVGAGVIETDVVACSLSRLLPKEEEASRLEPIPLSWKLLVI